MSELVAHTHATASPRHRAGLWPVALRLGAAVLACATAAPVSVAQPPTVSVTITGTATGPDEQPVKGATVYMMAVGAARPQLVATTTTDEKGGYEFRKTPVPLPVEGADAKSPEYVTVQVCATAPGRALAWSPQTYLYLNFPPAPQRNRIPLNFRLASQPQRADLSFHPSEALTGRIVDERGRPVAGVKVHLGGVDLFGASWDTAKLSLADLPGAPLTATTGPDGRFRLDAVPHGYRAGLSVTHPDYAEVSLFAATATHDEAARALGNLFSPDDLWFGDIHLTQVRPRSVPVRVVSHKTGQPLQDVQVILFVVPSGKTSTGAVGTTDAAGRAALRLPPGEYSLYVPAPRGTNYLLASDTVTVTASQAEQPRTIRLVPACTVEIEAVDADTGRPVPKVQFEQGPATEQAPAPVPARRGSFGSASPAWQLVDDLSTGFSPDYPGKATDQHGRLTSLVRPGTWLIRPRPPFVAVGERKPVELPEGETVKLRIRVREQK